jgi:hypothetical protein
MAFVNRVGRIAAPLLALPLTACPAPTHYVGAGINRLPTVPEQGCVEATIRATPGVTSVQFGKRDDKSFYLFPYFGNVVEHHYWWTYLASDLTVFVQIQHVRNSIEFHHYSPQPMSAPESRLAALKALIDRVQARLVAACGLPERKPGRAGRS